MTTQLLFSGFRATVVYYQWPRGSLDRVGRRFVRSLRQTMSCYQKVRRNPYSDANWNDLRVRFSLLQNFYLILFLQVKLARCTDAFDLLELEMDRIYDQNVPLDLRVLHPE